ncbi:hypothetical protein WA026_017534 [Henosepilachna vigintioctopunctata]|uniref:Cyclin-like domain-containing protein n=1 Tax=Henosepilachna vigintioctopunctata TaxID=420089 RepID=A0AAW1V1I6_9CUCU
MHFRYYKDEQLKNSASARDGIDFDTETKYRREGALFTIETGYKFGFTSDTINTAVVYFHRFYVFRSFAKYSRYVTACSCLLIAGKSEKTTKDLNDLINVAKAILTKQKITNHGLNSEVKVKEFEKTVLDTLKTDLDVINPYKFIIEYTRNFDRDQLKCRRIAWSFAADSLGTSLPLKFKPEMIAKAALYLAVKVCSSLDSTYKEPSVQKWCDDGNTQILEEIGTQIIYARVAHEEHPFGPPELEESEVTPSSAVTSHAAVTACSSKKDISLFAKISSNISCICGTFRKADHICTCINIAIVNFEIAFQMWQRVKRRNRTLESLFHVSKHLLTAISNSLNATSYIMKDISSASKWLASVLFHLFRTLSIC